MTICLINTLRDSVYAESLTQTLLLFAPQGSLIHQLEGPKTDARGLEYVKAEIQLKHQLATLRGQHTLLCVPLINSSACTTLLAFLSYRVDPSHYFSVLGLVLPRAETSSLRRVLEIVDRDPATCLSKSYDLAAILHLARRADTPGRRNQPGDNLELKVFNYPEESGPVSCLQQYLGFFCHDLRHMYEDTNDQNANEFHLVSVSKDWRHLESFLRCKLKWIRQTQAIKEFFTEQFSIAQELSTVVESDSLRMNSFGNVLASVTNAWGNDFALTINSLTQLQETDVYKCFKAVAMKRGN